MAGGDRTAPHSDLVAACVQYLEWQHAWVTRIHGHLGQRKGLPDVFAVIDGRMIAVDVKTGAAALSVHQERERAGLLAAGAIFVVCRKLEDVEDAVVAAGLGRPLLVRERR